MSRPADVVDGQRMIARALEYLKRGYRPIPIKAGTKEARIRWLPFKERSPTEDEIRTWWTDWPEDGIAILTGQGSVRIQSRQDCYNRLQLRFHS